MTADAREAVAQTLMLVHLGEEDRGALEHLNPPDATMLEAADDFLRLLEAAGYTVMLRATISIMMGSFQQEGAVESEPPVLLNGPTVNHLAGPYGIALCGWSTADPDRIDNPAWTDRSVCLKCQQRAKEKGLTTPS